MNRVMKISTCFISYLIFFPSILFGQSRLNGNVLTLAAGGTISIGSQLKITHPEKGSRYTFIYSELALRASSEDDLPYGISSSTANEEVTVKRFLERKGSRGSKYYIICRGSFINNAIDIDNALKAGEVQYRGVFNAGSSAPGNQVSNPNMQSSGSMVHTGSGNMASPGVGVLGASGAGSVNGTGGVNASAGANAAIGTNSTNNATNGVNTHIMRRPWDTAPVAAPKKDSVMTRDSSQRFVKAFKAVDSSTKQTKIIAAIPKSDSMARVERPLVKESPEARVAEKKAEIAIIPIAAAVKETKPESVVTAHQELPKTETAILKPEAESTEVAPHSVSTLMTLPTAESLKPKEVAPPAQQSKQETAAGYTKFSKLKQLKELLDAGVLTKAEFDIEKKKILASE